MAIMTDFKWKNGMRSGPLQGWRGIGLACAFLFSSFPARPQAAASQATPIPSQPPFQVRLPHAHTPWSPYRGSSAPEPVLANSPRLDRLIRDGKLYLSFSDAVALALENNLDLAIARYNIPIADTDILRTRSGAPFLGVNTGVVQNTPGGGVGGIGAGPSGAGGTSGGAGGAGAGAGGLVESTLGNGALVSSYDPRIVAQASDEHDTTPLINLQTYGVPSLQLNTGLVDTSYIQHFPSGARIEFDFDNTRQTVNSPYENITPALDAYWRFSVQQQLLAGFGLGNNLRYLHIAKNDKQISDMAFKDQVIVTVTQIADIYWDLAAAYQDERVKENSREFARKTLEDTRKQYDLQAVPEMDVLKAQAEVAARDQDLTISRTALQLEESLMKNAVTKQLDDPVLEEMPVVPTDPPSAIQPEPPQPLQPLIAQALQERPELAESIIDLDNRRITRKSLRNALLPQLAAVGYYSGSGLAGIPNPNYDTSLGPNVVNAPRGFSGALDHAFNNSAPDYLAGLALTIPLRNRAAKADQFRSELEYRQSELRLEELKKQIRIEVRNAVYALEQNRARLDAAAEARGLAEKTFEIMKQEQQLGAGSNSQTLSAEHDLALAESSMVTAQTAYAKAILEVYRATGTTLDRLGISIDAARTGTVGPAKP